MNPFSVDRKRHDSSVAAGKASGGGREVMVFALELSDA